MAKQPKPKENKGRNDNRKNGKASKTTAIKHQRTTLTGIQKIILGGGLMVNVQHRWKEKK